ncbi:MAG: YwaF family protein, partial [Erysipelotrichaceae bacterium]|nr:YwaF family protein [Erysipelotrichaceae bacterium]
GALAALIIPIWTNEPLWNFMHLHSVSVHAALVLYPVLLIADGFKPDFRNLPKVMLGLIVFLIPVYFLNRVLRTNFFFVNDSDGNVLSKVFAKILGEKLFVLGYLPVLLIVFAILYLPFALRKTAVK